MDINNYIPVGSHLLSNFIDQRLSSLLNESVIISGLDGAGKTTVCKDLIGKYAYTKYSFYQDYLTEYPWEHAYVYQIFDRCPLFEMYVYMELNSKRSEFDKELLSSFIKSHLHYFRNPLFLIYLHNLWDTGNEDQLIYNNLDEMKSRYIDIIEVLDRLGQQVIICTDKGIKQCNMLWNQNKRTKYIERQWN